MYFLTLCSISKNICVYPYIHIYFFMYLSICIFLPLVLLGKCVISSVLSHHNENLKQRTSVAALRETTATALGWTSVSAPVTAQFYLENKGKYILEAWGHADPKVKRRERRDGRGVKGEREGEPGGGGETDRDPWPFDSSFYVFSPPPGPPLCKLG